VAQNQRHPNVLVLESKALLGNPLGDPTTRSTWVYTPPGYRGEPLVALLALAGFTGNGPMLFNQDPLGESLSDRLDRLILTGACPPCLLVAPDCFTRMGGNQYIDSPSTGPYASHLVQEVIPAVEASYPVKKWGVFGKSSGGYGAIVLSMLYPNVFQAAANHSGDANFELCYLPDALETLDQVRSAGGAQAWLTRYWASSQRRTAKQIKTLGFLAMAAHYSPNRESADGFDLPFSLDTGQFRPEVWARWQAWDPVSMVSRYGDALRSLKLLFVDVGVQDEYGLHWGARALSSALNKHGVSHLYEEFVDGHMNIPYRFERSIPLLVDALVA
jgi:S-formylglutathione hydrolase FrmB